VKVWEEGGLRFCWVRLGVKSGEEGRGAKSTEEREVRKKEGNEKEGNFSKATHWSFHSDLVPTIQPRIRGIAGTRKEEERKLP
jgi:hypothetical protein